MTLPPLSPDLQKKLQEYRSRRAFNAKEWIVMKTAKLNDYMKRCGLKCCVTSVSGGIDSAVTLALCAAAMKVEGSPIATNVGVCQPIKSSEWALRRGRDNIKAVQAVEVVVDQSKIHTELQELVDSAVGPSVVVPRSART
jgi:NAD+ synthase (glutamine-hydrolysing)